MLSVAGAWPTWRRRREALCETYPKHFRGPRGFVGRSAYTTVTAVANLIRVPSLADERGVLTVLDGLLPFRIRRVYVIQGVPPGAVRGGHRHRRTRQALLCLSGSCEVTIRSGASDGFFQLAAAQDALVLEAADWHQIGNFTPDAVLLVLASEGYDPEDYQREPPG